MEPVKAIRFVVEIPVSKVERSKDGNILEDSDVLQDAVDCGLQQITDTLCEAEDCEFDLAGDVYGFWEYVDGFGNPVQSSL